VTYVKSERHKNNVRKEPSHWRLAVCAASLVRELLGPSRALLAFSSTLLYHTDSARTFVPPSAVATAVVVRVVSCQLLHD
jgi:hypothetical protein